MVFWMLPHRLYWKHYFGDQSNQRRRSNQIYSSVNRWTKGADNCHYQATGRVGLQAFWFGYARQYYCPAPFCPEIIKALRGSSAFCQETYHEPTHWPAGSTSDVFGHLISFIQAVALLHQYQRERNERGQIIATHKDYEVVRLYLPGPLARSLGCELTQGAKDLLEVVKDRGRFTIPDMVGETKLSDNTVRGRIKELQNTGQIINHLCFWSIFPTYNTII